MHCFGALVRAAAQASFRARRYKLVTDTLKCTNQSLKTKPCRAVSPLSQGVSFLLVPAVLDCNAKSTALLPWQKMLIAAMLAAGNQKESASIVFWASPVE